MNGKKIEIFIFYISIVGIITILLMGSTSLSLYTSILLSMIIGVYFIRSRFINNKLIYMVSSIYTAATMKQKGIITCLNYLISDLIMIFLGAYCYSMWSNDKDLICIFILIFFVLTFNFKERYEKFMMETIK